MIKEAIDRIVQLAKIPVVLKPEDVEGRWSDTSFQRILPILPQSLHSNNLESVVDFIAMGEEESYTVHIMQSSAVSVYGPKDEYGRRAKVFEVSFETNENRLL